MGNVYFKLLLGRAHAFGQRLINFRKITQRSKCRLAKLTTRKRLGNALGNGQCAEVHRKRRTREIRGGAAMIIALDT